MKQGAPRVVPLTDPVIAAIVDAAPLDFTLQFDIARALRMAR